jgi:predicted MPP superfamily phosphohydrolase
LLPVTTSRLRTTVRHARLALIFALAALGLYALWFEPSGLRAVVHPIELPAGSENLQGLRIAVIADLHAGAPYIGEAKIDDAVSLANAAKPDLILIAGDLVGQGVLGDRSLPIEMIALHLRPLRASLGVYAVLGNHDHWDDAVAIAAALRRVGIRVLSNEAVALRVGGQSFYLVGIDDSVTGHDDSRKALHGVPAGATALCLTHSPDLFPALPDTCSLTIAGHTHGGQVDLPLLGRLIVPSKYGQRYAAGFVCESRKCLFVSTGIGTSIIPVRFHVPPEVSILEVR